MRKEQTMRKLIVLAGACGLFVALALAPTSVAGQAVTQTLTPPPPPEYTCATGSVTICHAKDSFAYGASDTGLVCGSGASAFDIFDSATVTETKTRFYDRNGNLTERVFHQQYSGGEFSNPQTGAVVPYTQHDTITDVLAVPGDLSTATETTVGESIFRDPVTHEVVNLNAGRVVRAPDGTLEFRAGPQAFADYFGGDASAFDQLCAALGA
jgi:hypothetical protein